MIRVLESLSDKEGKLVIDVKDSEGQLKELVDYIKDVANAGHTFDVVVDPGNEDWEKGFEIDGDGAFSIKEVKFEKDDDKEDVEKKEESVQSEDDFVLALADVLKSMRVLNELWHQWDVTADCLNNEKYPFNKSFDEVCEDVNTWLEETKKISLNG